MPLLSTAGADSAQGYGLFKGVVALTTYTFPSGTSTWTAPSTTTQLETAVGKGGDGIAPFWTEVTPNIWIQPACNANPSIGATLAWSTVLGQLDSMFAAANAITTNPAGQNATLLYFYAYDWCNALGYWQAGVQYSANGLWRRTGTLSQSYGYTGNVPTPSSGTYYGPTSGGTMELYNEGANGGGTTGFGLTFPGGTTVSPSAPTTSFTNVAVTPNTTYTIVNRQSLTITYYA